MRALDLCCGEGGAAKGLKNAGFKRVVGMDVRAQPRYAGDEFIHADVATLWTNPAAIDWMREFDFIHASPPCQFGSELTPDRSRHVNLIPPIRALLDRVGKPYSIENVRAVRPHMIEPVSLLGTMFDLHMVTSTGQRFDLSRERLFETNWKLKPPLDPGTFSPIANVFGGHLRARSGPYRTGNGTGRTRDFIGEDKPALARRLMGMPWATMMGMSEAIPPAYAQYVAEQWMRSVRFKPWTATIHADG